MYTRDFITESICRVDGRMREVPKHPQASLDPRETITLGLLFAIKGVGTGPSTPGVPAALTRDRFAIHRWIKRDSSSLFPYLPEHTRLFRLFATHRG